MFSLMSVQIDVFISRYIHRGFLQINNKGNVEFIVRCLASLPCLQALQTSQYLADTSCTQRPGFSLVSEILSFRLENFQIIKHTSPNRTIQVRTDPWMYEASRNSALALQP